MIVKNYRETPHRGRPDSISGSVLDVEMTSPCVDVDFEECCKVCPNRVKKVTQVDQCIVVDVNLFHYNFTGHLQRAELTCKHGLGEIYNHRRKNYGKLIQNEM